MSCLRLSHKMWYWLGSLNPAPVPLTNPSACARLTGNVLAPICSGMSTSTGFIHDVAHCCVTPSLTPIYAIDPLLHASQPTPTSALPMHCFTHTRPAMQQDLPNATTDHPPCIDYIERLLLLLLLHCKVWLLLKYVPSAFPLLTDAANDMAAGGDHAIALYHLFHMISPAVSPTSPEVVLATLRLDPTPLATLEQDIQSALGMHVHSNPSDALGVQDDMHLVTWNVRGMRSRAADIHDLLHGEHAPFIAIFTETHMRPGRAPATWLLNATHGFHTASSATHLPLHSLHAMPRPNATGGYSLPLPPHTPTHAC